MVARILAEVSDPFTLTKSKELEDVQTCASAPPELNSSPPFENETVKTGP